MKSPKIVLWMIAIMGVKIASASSPDTWVQGDSSHFLLYSNTEAKIASAYLVQLEQFRYALYTLYGLTEDQSAGTPKATIYFVKRNEDLYETSPRFEYKVSGYANKDCPEGQFAVSTYLNDDLDGMSDDNILNQNQSQVTLFHEYTHDFMIQTSDQAYPRWYVEGFAEFYSTARIQGDDLVIGTAPSARATTLIWHDTHELSYEDILNDRWVPSQHPADGALVRQFYAQSWLLTHYILSDKIRYDHFKDFLKAYRRGDSAVAAFEGAFAIKVKDLPRILSFYLSKSKAFVFELGGMPEPKIRITRMPASADKLLLWDAAARCPVPNERNSILEKILKEAARYPDDPYALRVKARAEILDGNEWDAVAYLKAQVASNPKDADAQFMLGQAWFLMTVHQHVVDGETATSQMQSAQKALSQSYALNPLNATDLFYYSQALDKPGQAPSDNAIAAAIEAHLLAPSVKIFATRAALLLASQNRLEEARAALAPFASDPHAPADWLAWLDNIISVIDRHGTAGEVIAAFGGRLKPVSAQGANH